MKTLLATKLPSARGCSILIRAYAVIIAATFQVSNASDLLIADFEQGNYANWKVSGTAFGEKPASGTLPNQQPVTGFQGKGLVNSFFKGDTSTGALVSAEFTIERPYLNFLIGGGSHSNRTCINLLVDGQVVKTTTGRESEFLNWASWDVRHLQTRKARIEILDLHTGGWGHINVDHIVQSDEPPKRIDDREGAVFRAMASVNNAAERASKDPARPQYHFRPPGNWMNDPNAPIHYRGYYHMFYQHNPYGDAWNHMHWGHARSKDLVHWEHQPIALWPSQVLGEQHCFSGCAAVNGKGEPMIFYTSIGHPRPECWIALPEDDELVRWRKFPDNPILTETSPGTNYYDFRDPFVFRHEGRAFMVHGGNLNKGKGGQAVVSLYESENAELTKWKYRSILFKHPDPKVTNVECPLFFPLGNKFLLITSPHRACDYFVGTFNPTVGNFTVEADGMTDHSGQFYAPNCLQDGEGRWILWGWIRGFKEKMGWNGCLTLPRVLNIVDGRLVQTPAPELEKLRMRPIANNHELPNLAELHIPEGRFSLKIGSTIVESDGSTLNVAGTKVQLSGRSGPVRIFRDNSVLEVFADSGRECVTRVVGTEPLVITHAPNLRAWELKSIW